MSVRLVWTEREGEAIVRELEGEAICIDSSIPSPPGSRIVAVLESEVDALRGTSLRIKIHGCKKMESGRFLLRGRVLDLARTVREALDGELAQAHESANGRSS